MPKNKAKAGKATARKAEKKKASTRTAVVSAKKSAPAKVAARRAPARSAPMARSPVPPAKPGKDVKPRKDGNPQKVAPPGKPVKGGKAARAEVVIEPRPSQPGARRADGWMGPMPDKTVPRRTKLPQEGVALNKREMEQVLTVGTRGVAGEGGLKGRLVLYQGMPYLEVIGRDKRELWFLLQGPDQEVFPAYVDHKVSVSGLIRRFHPHGGSVDVRKYSARKPEETEAAEAPPAEETTRLRLLSPGELETLASPGMSVGLKGYATIRGRLEMSGDEFFLVVSNSGTRQQVAFTVEGKAAKGLKKYVGEVAVASGVVEKQTGWGGVIAAEVVEPRAPEFPPVSRDTMEVRELEISPGTTSPKPVEVKLNHGLVVTLAEKQGSVWSVEPQTAKRLSLREVIFHLSSSGASREFFFTPRHSGYHELEFFLGKLHNPMQVSRTFKVLVTVRAPEAVA